MATFELGVVILGAGASVRMGRPKLLLPWNNTTVIGQIISQWRALGAAHIAVVMRENDFALAAELDALDFPKSACVVNPQPACGMFSSIVCAANWNGWKNEISHWAVALGDQPHLKTETLAALLEFTAQHPGAVCQPEFAGRERHPVVLPREFFLRLKNPREASLKVFLEHSAAPRRRCAVDDAGLALDLDTPEDWQRARRRFAAP
jgi:molybdenum cofactor cytidylyltransferase